MEIFSSTMGDMVSSMLAYSLGAPVLAVWKRWLRPGSCSVTKWVLPPAVRASRMVRCPSSVAWTALITRLTLSPVRVAEVSGIPLAPWSTLSMVALKVPSGAADRWRMGWSGTPPALRIPAQSPAMEVWARAAGRVARAARKRSKRRATFICTVYTYKQQRLQVTSCDLHIRYYRLGTREE